MSASVLDPSQAKRPARPSKPLNGAWIPKYLAVLRETGSKKEATARAGVSTSSVHDYKKRHPDFAREAEESLAAWGGPAWRREFLAELARTGRALESLTKVGVSNQTAYYHRRNDDSFKAAWDAAIAAAEQAKRRQEAQTPAEKLAQAMRRVARVEREIARRQAELEALRLEVAEADPSLLEEAGKLAAAIDSGRVSPRRGPLFDLVDEYCRYLDEKVGTRKNTVRARNTLRELFGRARVAHPDDLNSKAIGRGLRRVAKRGVSEWEHDKQVRAFCDWACETGHLQRDPTRSLPKVSPPARRSARLRFSDEKLEMLLAAAEASGAKHVGISGTEWAETYHGAACTGLPLRALRRVTVGQFHLNERVPFVRLEPGQLKETQRLAFDVPILPPSAARRLDASFKKKTADARAFHLPGSRALLTRVFALHLAAAGIDKRTEADGRVEAYEFRSLRDTYVERGARASVPPLVMKEWLGHSDVRLTLNIYRRILPEGRIDELARHPELTRWLIARAEAGPSTPAEVPPHQEERPTGEKPKRVGGTKNKGGRRPIKPDSPEGRRRLMVLADRDRFLASKTGSLKDFCRMHEEKTGQSVSVKELESWWQWRKDQIEEGKIKAPCA